MPRKIAPKNIANVVMVEDSPSAAALAIAFLADEPYRVHLAGTAAAGLGLIDRLRPEAILLDINLPDMSGIEVLDRLRAAGNGAPVVMVTGLSAIETVVDCMRRGAFDYIAKPFGAERIRVTLRNAIERRRMTALLESYREPYEHGFHGMIGASPAMHAVYRIIECAATSDAAVFISGESGTGKELAAEALHRASRRRTRPLVALNCAALPPELAESELFGHVRGAFTGATADRTGAVELAQGGTLFLDEVCEMPLALQAKLLRFLHSGGYRRVGDSRLLQADVRLISATNRDPRDMVRRRLFREDLYYRLHVIPLEMPPLAARGDDAIAISRHLLVRAAAAEDKSFDGFTTAAERWICDDRWPGNVRELDNAIRYAVVMGAGGRIDRPALAAARAATAAQERNVSGEGASGPGTRVRGGVRTLAEIERAAIEAAIEAAGGKVNGAARLLGINASTIHRKRRAWTAAARHAERRASHDAANPKKGGSAAALSAANPKKGGSAAAARHGKDRPPRPAAAK